MVQRVSGRSAEKVSACGEYLLRLYISGIAFRRLFDLACLFVSPADASGSWIRNQLESVPGMSAVAVSPLFDTKEKLDDSSSEQMREFRDFAA